MQKSAASAKQAGVSYEQLVTMLTIITSKTQLGGNQAGTALQTLMYRLYRVNEGEDFYDENGNRIAANQASKALDQLGVSIYDDNGQPRGAYDIMVDIAKNWDSADNISQEMVLNALGAGRQRSNIATLIQGMAEDNGELLDKYMNLASGSEGITDEKYLAYLDSLNAALTTVQSSFDQLVASFEISGAATTVLDFISEFIQGLAAAEEASGALSKTLTALGLVLAGIAMVTHPLATIATLAIGGGLWAVSSWGNSVGDNSPITSSEIAGYSKEVATREVTYSTKIEEAQALLNRGSLTEEEVATVQSTLDELAAEFGIATMEFHGTAEDLLVAAGLIQQANDIMRRENEAAVKKSFKDSEIWLANEVSESYIPQNSSRNIMDA